ncbi:ATP-binding protein [Evansella sp. AB-rgal1]|uniref:ATP-binding protein n=1 Tax=Evansella sp. AB-rgal1 TaxID=3242696 RepID=UPI00359E2775
MKLRQHHTKSKKYVIYSVLYFLTMLVAIIITYVGGAQLYVILMMIIISALLFERIKFIRERKALEEERKLTLKIVKEYERFLEETPVAILFIKNNTIRYINNRCAQLFQVKRKKEIIGNSLFDYLALKKVVPLEDDSIAYEKTVGNTIGVLTDCKGMETDVILHYHQLFFQHEWGYGIVITDITKQRQNEKRLEHSEQLSVIGELAAGIAHEIRNPLTSIMGFLQLMKNTDEDSEKYKDIMSSELQRINLIVNELLLLSKPKEFEFQKTNIVQLIKTVVTIVNTQAILYNIEIKVSYKPKMKDVTVYCEENKLKQVFLNILKNGIEAMSKEGTITINIIEETSVIHIIIIDEGPGIPPEQLSKLGKRFYTTKDDGTGLGLMISMNIVREHKGEISITSEVGKGTEMKVTLPKFAS